MRALLLILLLYPFLEIATLVSLADHFGSGPVLLWVIFTAILGIGMLRNQKLAALLTLGSVLNQGERVSIYSLLWPLRYLLAGILFLIPGVISDLFAVLLLLPFKGPALPVGPRPTGTVEDVIEGEYHRVDEPTDPSRRIN